VIELQSLSMYSVLSVSLQGVDVDSEIERAEFEKITQELTDRVLATVLEGIREARFASRCFPFGSLRSHSWPRNKTKLPHDERFSGTITHGLSHR